MVDEVISLFPGCQLYETEHFLFVSNIPPQQVGPYIASLDRMYDWMCQLYGVPRDHKVWLGGKAPIFAFLEQEQFDAFEERYFPEARESLRTLANVYGLSHSRKPAKSSSPVTAATIRTTSPRCSSTKPATASSTATKRRPAAELGRRRHGRPDRRRNGAGQHGRQEPRVLEPSSNWLSERSLGGMLTAERIEAWQYGVASNLNRFLLQANRQNYVRFIEALKEGHEVGGGTPRSLRQHARANCSPQYGRWINVADLRP